MTVRWKIVHTDDSCDSCGWPAPGPHYRATWEDGTSTNHCSACHTPGRDWRRVGDSEKDWEPRHAN